MSRLVGLTGGIGSGKSTVARLLRERGAAVIDADAIAREVVAPGSEGLAEIRARFGDGVLAPDGNLDRKALAAIVFEDEKARQDLEALTHPRIAAESARQIQAARDAGAEVIVYEAALLVEKGLHQGMDVLVVVSAPPEVQIDRVRARDGASEEEARARLAAQLPLGEKTKVADHVVDNGGSLEETERQLDVLWKVLRDGDDEEEEDGR